MSEEVRERLAVLESRHEHMDKTLQEISRTQKEISNAITRFSMVQGEIHELRLRVDLHQSELHALDKAKEKTEMYISSVISLPEKVGELSRAVQKNTFITNIASFVAASVFTGGLGLFFWLIQRLVELGVWK